MAATAVTASTFCPVPLFTPDQARAVLDQLALCSVEQHKNDKLVFYADSVWLESSSGAWRTAAAWGSWTTGLVYSSWSSRDIRCLPVYVTAATERIKHAAEQTFSAEQSFMTKSSVIKPDQDRVKNCKTGLEALKKQYTTGKGECIDAAISSLTQAGEFLETRSRELVSQETRRVVSSSLQSSSIFDRIETKLDQILNRLTALEQRLPPAAS